MLLRIKSLLKSFVGSFVGDFILGAVDFVRFPERRGSWGGPFNGQHVRAQLFRSLVEQLSPVAIVETGTYLGTTTEFMARFGLPIFTIEGDRRRYGFSKLRLCRLRNVRSFNGDSRKELRRLFDEKILRAFDQTILFYLDAHWKEDLPLAEELEIIFERCPTVVIVVDDFRVPDDDGYGYDDYGVGKALTFEYIEPTVTRQQGVACYYPATPAIEETGAKRGCVVLARGIEQNKVLASLPLLVERKTNIRAAN